MAPAWSMPVKNSRSGNASSSAIVSSIASISSSSCSKYSFWAEAAEAVAGIERVAITAHPGQRLQAWPEGGAYPGFVFAAGSTPGEVERSLHAASAKLALIYQD